MIRQPQLQIHQADAAANIQIAQRVSPAENSGFLFMIQDLTNILASQDAIQETVEHYNQALTLAAELLDDTNPKKAEVYATAADFFLNHDAAEQALPLAQYAFPLL